MWFLYALIYALLSSFGIILAKKVMQGLDEYSFIWAQNLVILPFLFLLIILFYEIPHVDLVFWKSVAISSFLDAFAVVLAYRAIKMSDVSLVNPISAFNPVFVLFISYLVLGETITTKGLFGILIVVFGAYILNLGKVSKSIFSPIKSLFSHRGVQLSLIAYLLWAVTPIFQKIAIFHTNPRVPAFVSLVGLTIALLVYTLLVFGLKKFSLRKIVRQTKNFLLIGVLGAVGQAAAFMAFSLTNLGYVTAIFRLSMIFTVIFGWLFFKEQNIKERLLGSLVMLLGVILLVT